MDNRPSMGTGVAQRGANTIELQNRYKQEYLLPWQLGDIPGPMLTFQQWAEQVAPQQPIAIPVGNPGY